MLVPACHPRVVVAAKGARPIIGPALWRLQPDARLGLWTPIRVLLPRTTR